VASSAGPGGCWCAVYRRIPAARRTTRSKPWLAVGEMIVDFLRVHDAALAHEIQQEFGSLSARGRPWQSAFGRGAAIGTRMHVRLQSPGHETVVDKEIFVDAELCVATFEIAGPVVPPSTSGTGVSPTPRPTSTDAPSGTPTPAPTASTVAGGDLQSLGSTTGTAAGLGGLALPLVLLLALVGAAAAPLTRLAVRFRARR